MANKCSICVHPDRAAIESALVQGVTLREIAGKYGVSRSAVSRHYTNGHMQIVTLAPVTEVESISGTGVLQRMSELAQEAADIGQTALDTNPPKLHIALQAIREQSRINEQVVRLAEILTEKATGEVTLDSWLDTAQSRLENIQGS